MKKASQPQKLVHDNDAYELVIPTAFANKHDLDHVGCLHCGNEIPSYRKNSEFCCNGCKFVFQLIKNEKFDKFYTLTSGKKLQPKIFLFKKSKNLDWVDQAQINQHRSCEFALDGMECAACVWLVKTLGKRMDIPGVEVNSALGRIRIQTQTLSSEKLKEFFGHLQDFGYQAFPIQDDAGRGTEGKALLSRIGVLAASVMNSMIFSFAMYLGLTEKEPLLFHVFGYMNFLFCTLAVGVGGSYFFRKAWAGIRVGMFHFDLPVSIGMLAAYAGSTYSYFFGNNEHVYFDTLCTFIFLMLVGRLLQVRWVEKNRSAIANSKELESMTVRRIGKNLEEIAIHQIQADDMLLISPGNMIPIACELISPTQASISNEWITGESEPQLVEKGNSIAAGSQNISMQSLTVISKESYRAGDLSRWMFSSGEKNPTSSFWQTYAQKYSIMVLSLLTFGFLFFAFSDLPRAIKTAVTISLVTCPCGIGIGIPMAQMVAQRKLLAMGIYIRDLNLLEHLQKIKTLVFDKTGTLTLAELRIKNPEAIDALSLKDQSVLFHASAQSQHPISQAIYQHMITYALAWEKIEVNEIPGQGLHVECGHDRYFLGKGKDQSRFSFIKNDDNLMQLEFEETLLEDARPVFANLSKQNYQLHVLSGDKAERVEEVANKLGIQKNQYSAQCTPMQKEEWLRAHHPESILFLGDGLNDSLALKSAMISGASLSNSFNLASHANFYFSTLDIRWLPSMLSIGKRFSKVVRGNVTFSIFYNCTAVVLSMMGILTPLVAAIVMPTVSLLVVGASVQTMKKGN